MNVWLVRAALRLRGLPPGARVVLLAHADACPPSGRTCLPGLDELAAACELSPQHVLRLRAQLVAAGHLRKLAAAHPGQRPVYEVLPHVPIPVPGTDRTSEPQRIATSGRTDADNGSHRCNPPYKTLGITPPYPPADPVADRGGWSGGEGDPQATGTTDPTRAARRRNRDIRHGRGGSGRSSRGRAPHGPAGPARRARATPAGAGRGAARGRLDGE